MQYFSLPTLCLLSLFPHLAQAESLSTRILNDSNQPQSSISMNQEEELYEQMSHFGIMKRFLKKPEALQEKPEEPTKLGIKSLSDGLTAMVKDFDHDIQQLKNAEKNKTLEIDPQSAARIAAYLLSSRFIAADDLKIFVAEFIKSPDRIRSKAIAMRHDQGHLLIALANAIYTQRSVILSQSEVNEIEGAILRLSNEKHRVVGMHKGLSQ